MPSPTSSTWPTSAVSDLAPNSLISRVRTDAISLELMRCMETPLVELVPQGFEPALDAGVVQPVADAHHQPAQQVGIDARVQHRFEPQRLPQFVHQIGRAHV